jgi:hypothetical protein
MQASAGHGGVNHDDFIGTASSGLRLIHLTGTEAGQSRFRIHAAQFPDHPHPGYPSVNFSGVDSTERRSSPADARPQPAERVLGCFRTRVGVPFSTANCGD